MSELKRNYAVSTKWLAFITLPIFLVLFLFPEVILNLFFSTTYVPAALVLRILSLDFIINNLLGPNGATLIAMGHTQFLMWATLATAILNIVVNIPLIPPMGTVAAAIASAVSPMLVNIIRTARVYSLCQAQPLSKKLLKPAITCVGLAFLVKFVAQQFLPVTW